MAWGGDTVFDRKMKPIRVSIVSVTQTPQYLLQELKYAPHLSHLGLPGASRLALGFDGGPDCGNAYFGARGRKYRRQVEGERTKAIERAAKIALEVLPHLQSVSIGDITPVVKRDEQGHVIKLVWEWTDRMSEYLDFHWPLLEGGDDWRF